MSVSQDILEDVWNDVELILYDNEPSQNRIGVRFHRVDDVKFSGFGGILGLYFQGIQERGWEKLRYVVGDYEDEKIHLFCHEITLFDPRYSATFQQRNSGWLREHFRK